MFKLPPLPTASFRILTTTKGIWTRAESVEQMNKMKPVVDSAEYKFYDSTHLRHVSINDIKKMGDAASVVLYVQGKALKEAEVFFENHKLQTIPLKPNKVNFSEKKGPNSVSIVIETSRGPAGWQDINIPHLMDSLINNGLSAAEGSFYVLIVDEFNRKIRFDIGYFQWYYDNVYRHSWISQNIFLNWWDKDSNGTDNTVRNEWTLSSSYLIGGQVRRMY